MKSTTYKYMNTNSMQSLCDLHAYEYMFCTYCIRKVVKRPHKACLVDYSSGIEKKFSPPGKAILEDTLFFAIVFIGTNLFVKTQYGKSETNIPRKGIARPQSQLPHSCVCERFIYSRDRSAFSAAGKYVDRSWEYIIPLTDT
jgi:hypothetical protein